MLQQPAAPQKPPKRESAVVFAEIIGKGDPAVVGQTLVPEIFTKIVKPVLDRLHGSRLKFSARAIALEFDTPEAALTAAIEIHASLETRNARVADELNVRFRTGLDFGTVIQRGTEVAGNGAAIAWLLHSKVGPGELCVSHTVFTHFQAREGLHVRALGPQQLPNIETPVPAYRISTTPNESVEVQLVGISGHAHHQEQAIVGVSGAAARPHAADTAYRTPAQRAAEEAASARGSKGIGFGGIAVGLALVVAVGAAVKYKGLVGDGTPDTARRAPDTANRAPATAPQSIAAQLTNAAQTMRANKALKESLLTAEEKKNNYAAGTPDAGDAPTDTAPTTSAQQPTTAVPPPNAPTATAPAAATTATAPATTAPGTLGVDGENVLLARCTSDVEFCHTTGLGFAKDRANDTAARFFGKACELGLGKSCEALAFLSPTPKQAAELHAKACALSDAGGCNQLGLAHLTGNGVEASPVKANEAFEKACSLQNGEACMILAARTGKAEYLGKGCGHLGLQLCVSAVKNLDIPRAPASR
ncbi:MAG: hypothetical protein HY075_16130 [Deltaproteobacteria bacterium]|nr:hypothetical protein [Deltaproteobacteria bacterium]